MLMQLSGHLKSRLGEKIFFDDQIFCFPPFGLCLLCVLFKTRAEGIPPGLMASPPN